MPIPLNVFELEAKGEWIVQRVPEPWVGVTTKYGRIKKIPAEHTWHHKSCGQCGHIPGYSTAIYWLNRALDFDYNDPKDQPPCTAWTYYASATSNVGAQAAVAMRNFGAAYESGYFPTIHCGTSYGHYKEVREELVAHAELRDEVRRICDKLGKPFVMPEEIVHYSEWVYAMRHEFAQPRVRALPGIDPPPPPACHYHKLVVEDAIYDPDVYGGQRTAVVSAVVTALGANVKDYSTRFDCCGFCLRPPPPPAGRCGGGVHGARGERQGLLDLVRLLRLRLPPHPRPARLHALLRHAAQDRSHARGGQPRRRPDPRHRLRHDARPEPVRGPRPRREGGRAGHVRGPVRGARHGRPPLSRLPAALAQHRVPAAAREDGHRLARALARVRRRPRAPAQGRQAVPDLGGRRCLRPCSSWVAARAGWGRSPGRRAISRRP